jgi:PIN domain nuclease of toxin-antitoxin system
MGSREIMTSNNFDVPILLDTHVIIWALLKPDELSSKVRAIIELAQKEQRLLMSSISLWEIAMLKSKKRINIYEPLKDFLQSIIDIDGIKFIDITAKIAAESVVLTDDFHGDPADRIITATAISESAILLTRDEKILSWAQLGNIRTIKA